jgi:Fe-S-cluster containining protein
MLSQRIITEIELMERYANDRADENWRFRTYVKHRLNLGDAALDTVVRDTADEVMEQVDCTTCGHCCRTLQIVVDDFDIGRIARRLGEKPEVVKRKYVRREKDGELVFNRQPCPFLEGNICTVYEDRPQACRDYPFLHETGFRQRMLMFLDNTFVCPIVFNTCESLKRRLPFRKRKR